MNENKVVIAGLQLFCDKNKENMLLKATNMMKEALECNKNIDLFVLPEQFYQIDTNPADGEEYGENAHMEFERWLERSSSELSINIIAGSYAVIDENNNKKIKNRTLIADREGNIVGKYDKIHLFDAFGIKESEIFESGNELGLFDLDIGKVGVLICYDVRFPEVSRALVESGAEILCIPAAFYRPNSDQWDILVKSTAVYNIVPVIAVNQYGTLPTGRGFFGRSMIIDPKGVVLAGNSDCEGYFIGVIDKKYTEKCRKANPELINRRYDLYKNWV